MKIVKELPPNFDAIDSVFRVRRRRGVIFCYGDVIFNPDGVHIPHHLLMHEAVHSARQAGFPEAWWNLYLQDQDFRLAEEIPAHRAEYAAFCNKGRPLWNKRRDCLKTCAQRLSGPLYGNLITFDEARRIIEAEGYEAAA